MEAGKNLDKQFGVHIPSGRHTIRNASNDIEKIASYLREEGAAHDTPERSDSAIADPLQIGMGKIVGGWFEQYISRSSQEDIELAERGSIQTDYEIYDNF